MTRSTISHDALSPTKRALVKIRDLKRQLAEAQRPHSGDIAIVSMACRFPRRSRTPELFWNSLMAGTDEVGEIPNDRWDLEAYYDANPDAPGKMYARHGVFLEDLDQMDPDFFGISPREATWIDPQQRMLLEVSWEALERAGWPADKIGDTGLFIGWMHNDYQNESSDSLLNLNPYIATGSAGSFLSGRLSYYLGLHGPSVAIDTACSSSLVALHLACQSLHRGECERALVGGVNAIVSPTTNILTCKLKALSPVGHSRAFDAQADGYLRGEGCGVVTLRRLADARRDGDHVMAVIRGSAIGHNGFSSGLTVPNPLAQERVIRDALQRAGLDPARVDYLEAHGTGTELGDPIEMQAAAAVLGENRDRDKPLLVSSVKTNIGHLEAAAGIAGLIKVLLAFQNDLIPPQRNFDDPNPHIPWDQLPVKVVVEPTAWPNNKHRIASVSAFGMSGTNAHVVLESPRENGHVQKPNHKTRRSETSSAESQGEQAQLLVLSGKSEDALRDLADGYRQWLSASTKANLADVAFMSGAGRRHFDHRAAMVVKSNAEAQRLLQHVGTSGEDALLRQGQCSKATPKVAWQFTGQGSQYVGMAQELYATQATFRAALDECDAAIHDLRGESLLHVLFRHADAIDDTRWTQPALFAIQKGLVKLLQSWGLKPDVVLGHSVGQYAAACVAGIMTWDDGLRLISERGRLIGDLPPGGAMVAVFCPIDDLKAAMAEQSDVTLAALNGTHAVMSGPESSVLTVAETLSQAGARYKRLTTSHAFHSKWMDPILEPFQRAADQLDFDVAQIPLVCNVTGDVQSAREALTSAYWSQHIREPVRYSDSIATLERLGCDVLLEIGPQPILSTMAAAAWPGTAPSVMCCLRKDRSDAESLLSAVGQLYVDGVTPDFSAMHAGQGRQRLVLPTYPFQRRRFWGPAKPQAREAEVHTAHPLLGDRRPLAGLPNQTRYESWVAPDQPGWLEDHRVMGDVVFPGAAYVEVALAAAKQGQLCDLKFEQPLRPTDRTRLQTIVQKGESDQQTIELYSTPDANERWVRHFSATIAVEDQATLAAVDREAIAGICPTTADVAEFYQMMDGFGLHYGPQFQTIQSLQYGDRDVMVHLKTAGDVRGYALPPMLLDGAFHSLAIGMMRESEPALFLPVGIDRIQTFGTVDSEVWCHATWTQPEGETRAANLLLFDSSGQVVARIEGLKLRQLDRAALRQIGGSGPQRLLYEMKWKPCRLPAANPQPNDWLVIRSAELDESVATAVIAKLNDAGQHAIQVQLEPGLAQPKFDADDDSVVWSLSPDSSAHWTQLIEHVRSARSSESPHGIVWILGDGQPEADSDETYWARTEQNCAGLLSLIATLNEHEIRRLPRGFQLVTCDGVTIHDGGPTSRVNPAQAQFWGCGRVIGAEQPELRCRLINLQFDDEAANDKIVQSLVDVLINDSPENQLAIRNDGIFVPRLASLRLPQEAEESAGIVQEDASYLITGGLGMLGRQAAMWLAQQGAKHVVLVSRRAPSEAAAEFIQQIQELGCCVEVHCADIGVQSDVEKLLGRFGDELPSLRGVIHAAGVLDDAMIIDQTWERFQKVLAPKVQGAWNLHRATIDIPLDFFILYSSAASVLGSPGQSNYATSNAYLDGVAWGRRAMGLPALSVNWGPWTEGMADNELVMKRLALQGIAPLTVDEAHRAMQRLLDATTVQATVLDVDWRRMRMGLSNEPPPLLEDIAPTGFRARGGDSALVEKIRKLPVPARRELLMQTVQNELQQIFSTADALDPDTPLIDMGLDSLMAVEFSTRLQHLLGEDFAIAPTLLYDYHTVSAISDYLLGLVTELPDAEPEIETAQTTVVAKSQDEVVIVGMACRFPGASNVTQYWDNLQQGVDAIREIPPDRWDVDGFFHPTPAAGKMYTREGGFLDDIAHFDADFFNISGQEACWIDPQHRMLLEVSCEALEDAGIPTHPLSDSNVGVFMGIMSQDYGELLSAHDVELIDAFQGAGLAHSAGVGRISYLLGFEGPSIAIDSASSSSLVAVHQASRSLLDGNCNLALAGGVNAILTPTNTLLLCKAGMLSPDGRCKSFSADANGFARAEGCGVVVLKRRRDAERDGDRILAVIRGSAVRHNGFSGGLTTPSSRSQERVMREALDDAGLQPTDVQYMEAHGTGTELGDPIEIRAAAAVLGKGRSADEPLLVGSAKANIGHLEAAGGVSGLIKTVSAMQAGAIPRQLHFDQPSPHVPWDRLPLKIVAEPTAWPECEQRIAAVNALGMSGTNAHVILGSAPSSNGASPSIDDRSHHLLVLSARDEAVLRQLAQRYKDHLQCHSEVDLADLCHTAAVGRRHFEYRAALLVDSREQASRRLDALAKGESLPGVNLGRIGSAPKVACVFRGVDETTREAGTALSKTEPVFREVVDRLSQNLHEEQNGDGHPAGSLVSQFTLQMGLMALWRSWGIDPDVVAGYGVGQYSAACVAGVIRVEDALKLVAAHERLLLETINDEALDQFEALADTLDYLPPDRPLICNLTGQVVPVHRVLGGSYWRRQCVEDASLSASLETLAQQDCNVVLEVGDRPMLTPDTLEAFALPVCLASLQWERDETATMLEALGHLYVSGSVPDFASLDRPWSRKRISLPTYPFQRTRYWITDVGKHVAK